MNVVMESLCMYFHSRVQISISVIFCWLPATVSEALHSLGRGAFFFVQLDNSKMHMEYMCIKNTLVLERSL